MHYYVYIYIYVLLYIYNVHMYILECIIYTELYILILGGFG